MKESRPDLRSAVKKGDSVYSHFEMDIEEASPEYSRVIMPVSEKTVNRMGFVHGAVIYALADIAFGVASNHGEETGTVTLSSHISFLSPGREGPLTGEARCLRKGRRIVVYDVDIKDARGRLLAHATFEGCRTDFSFRKLD